ncbi:putative Mg2+ transporter-C (MgtC) family protein [Tranquillimonas rosea]|uniref:Protein MgtC n=1 Tax=Tranquillimonas rosea TaxID=641238 RepID=A0A1H9WE71_9RHOB|nr:MgtC/SapB family protein [Tranquillimonas rosea]SES32236.1 putative Mg2+ transporter-C (MgtC) family protein [Tranquillimonas rosea]
MLERIVDELNGSFAAVPLMVAAIRLVAAMVLGGLVGLERERREKPAGLRTHMLVAVAACLFSLIALELSHLDFGMDRGDRMRIDPLRLIEAVTAGVAFLAAGVIITSGGKVRHLTTGASMWLAGAIGLSCGAGQIPLALLATFLVVLVLVVLRRIESWIGTHD